MALTTVHRSVGDESALQSGFYVPRFELRITGSGLPRGLPQNVLRDIVEITYKDDVKTIDSVELTVNNWDDEITDFKYTGHRNGQSDDPLLDVFKPCSREFELRMGYLDELELMMTGTFTTMQANFPHSGKPVLTVRGLNVLHQLRRKQYTHAWTEKKESQIAANIQTLLDPKTRSRRFPLRIETSRRALSGEAPIRYKTQENQYDIDFLLTLARSRGYDVAVRETADDKWLYFGPADPNNADSQITTYTLEWGRSLIDFNPTLTTANQVSKVTVRGWNRDRKRPIVVSRTLDDLAEELNQDHHETIEQCDAREEHIVDHPVFTEDEAEDYAYAVLSERQKDYIKASGTTIGLPRLRAGLTIRIEGVGSLYSGSYYVTATDHIINDSGYLTKFRARRLEA